MDMINDLYIREIGLCKDNTWENKYPFSLPIVEKFNGIRLDSPVTFIMGDNGTDKSTLLEAIAVAYGFNAEGGSRNFNFSTSETHSVLHNYIKIIKSPNERKMVIFFVLRVFIM